MIEARNLTRRYGDFTAVDDVSLSIGDGEIVGLLGPNGAGKTTTLRMLTGFLPPSSGAVTVAGHDLLREPSAARRRMGYLPEHVALYPEMRVQEYLSYRARLYGYRGAARRAALGRAVEQALLGDVRLQVIGTLSKGYRQRVGLAAAILHQPEVLILDEPSVGLDPRQIIAIRELIRELGRTRTLLLSTHILPEVELLCHRVLIVDGGRVVAEGSPESLRQSWQGHGTYRLTVKDDPAGAADALSAVEGVESIRRAGGGGRFELRCAAGVDPREEIFRCVVASGWVLLELAEQKASLEEVFVRLTTRDDEGVVEVQSEATA